MLWDSKSELAFDQKLTSSRRRRERSRSIENTMNTITATKIATMANLITVIKAPPTAIKLLNKVMASKTNAEMPASAFSINAMILFLYLNLRGS